MNNSKQLLKTLNRSLGRKYMFYFQSYFSYKNSREIRLRNLIEKKFEPLKIEIKNESYKHSVPKEAETHFNIFIVSDKFNEKSLINRHKMVFACLKDEMGEKKENKLYSLNLKLKTPKEYNENTDDRISSPGCMSNNKN